MGSAEDNKPERMEVRESYDEGLRNLHSPPNVFRVVQMKDDAKYVQIIMHGENKYVNNFS
jgi:hypothetical protein